METLIEQLIRKMGLYDEANILEKTTELVRLLELRSTNVSLQVNEYGKIVLCADLAAVMLGIAFDKENALKLSGLRKSHYVNNKRLFEKLLDLTKIVGVNDICIQLGLNELTQKSDKLLELFKLVVASKNTDIDMSHPQYAAMAVYQACKLDKKKISKSKILSYSNLRPTQWTQLEQRWDKFIAKYYMDMIDKKLEKVNGDNAEYLSDKTAGKKENKVVAERDKAGVEDYEHWKRRMLEIAKRKLKNEQIENRIGKKV